MFLCPIQKSCLANVIVYKKKQSIDWYNFLSNGEQYCICSNILSFHNHLTFVMLQRFMMLDLVSIQAISGFHLQLFSHILVIICLNSSDFSHCVMQRFATFLSRGPPKCLSIKFRGPLPNMFGLAKKTLQTPKGSADHTLENTGVMNDCLEG